jgi:hypothetical protein
MKNVNRRDIRFIYVWSDIDGSAEQVEKSLQKYYMDSTTVQKLFAEPKGNLKEIDTSEYTEVIDRYLKQ